MLANYNWDWLQHTDEREIL